MLGRRGAPRAARRPLLVGLLVGLVLFTALPARQAAAAPQLSAGPPGASDARRRLTTTKEERKKKGSVGGKGVGGKSNIGSGDSGSNGLAQASSSSDGDGITGSGISVKRKGKGGKAVKRPLPPPHHCHPSLYDIAKASPDLQTLVAVQSAAKLSFFSPFGRRSKRPFTLLAPTDAAWNTTFAQASDEERQALRDGIPALLLYHQILSGGYTIEQLAARNQATTALATSMGKDNDLSVGKYKDDFTFTGLAPTNYAIVLRQHEACGARMLVIDTVLLPAEVDKLPDRLETTNPINATAWEHILDIIEGEGEAPPDAQAADDSAVAGAPAPAEAQQPEEEQTPNSGGSGSGGGGGGGGGGSQLEEKLAAGQKQEEKSVAEQQQKEKPVTAEQQEGEKPAGEQQQQQREEEAPAASPPPPPPLPGSPPDCTALAASGQLMLAVNGTLLTTGCEAVEAAVISSGTTQTVVSDAGQAGQVPREAATVTAQSLELELPVAPLPLPTSVAARACAAPALAMLFAACCCLLGS